MNHYNGDVEKKQDAVEVCIEGLMDEETHLSELDAAHPVSSDIQSIAPDFPVA